jgi:hypothetical protein
MDVIASAAVPGWITFVVGTTLAIGASLIAIANLWTNHTANTRRAAADLLAYLETTRLDIALWRLDQMTRRGEAFSSIKPQSIDQLERDLEASAHLHHLGLLRRALATDWSAPTAHMHDVYYYAIRVHAWLNPNQRLVPALLKTGMSPGTKARLINDTFGPRLLSLFLDHRIVSCRIRGTNRPVAYFPTHYGLFDPRYTALVDELFEQLTTSPNMGANLWVLPRKHAAINNYLADLSPLTPPFDDTDSRAHA